MKNTFTAMQRRRLAWLAGGIGAMVVAVPLMPSVASAFSSDSSTSGHAAAPTIVHVDIVAAGARLAGSQIAQPHIGAPVFVGCPTGRAVDGGYSLPDGLVGGSMLESAPAEDNPAHWNFRYSGLLPVGAKFYAVCWQG